MKVEGKWEGSVVISDQHIIIIIQTEPGLTCDLQRGVGRPRPASRVVSLAPVYTRVLATVQGYTTFGILFYRVEFLRYLLLHLSSQLAAGDIENTSLQKL